MKTRVLGKSNIEVSALGLGCMGMSPGLYGTPDDAQSLKTLYAALDMGITFFDTADMYGVGHNEEFIGKVLKPFRDKIVLGTKCGLVVGPDGLSCNSTKSYMKSACDVSLKRLGVDVIDVYYLHRSNPAIPIEESMEAMAELHQEGKIRSVGLSEVGADIIRRADKVFPVTAVQSEYSVMIRDAAESVLPTCKELNIAFVPFSPIGRGFLSGTIQSTQSMNADDFRRHLPYFEDQNIAHNLALVDAIGKIAQEKGRTPVQIGLAWLLAQWDQIMPIPGSSKVKHLQENIQAVDIELSPADLKILNDLCDAMALKGQRYPVGMDTWFVH